MSAYARAMSNTFSSSNARVFVLLESANDVAAVQVFARKLEIDTSAAEFVNLQGTTNIGRIMKDIRQVRSDADVVGLCDAADTRSAEKALNDDGLPVQDATDLPMYGFFVCERDLEDELIRALGADAARTALLNSGLASKFDALRTQPEWADKSIAEQVDKFCHSASGRKELAAAVLADAVPADAIPEPVSMLLDRIRWA